MGYSPNKWGKQGWHFIHMVALAYPEQPDEKTKQQYYDFFGMLGNVLPCKFCALHYQLKFENNPPKLNNREELFKWTVDMHNMVNKENNRRELSYSDALKEIQKNATPNNLDLAHGLTFSLIMIISIISISYLKVYKL